MKILGYVATRHFREQMSIRGIDEMLVSVCLAKGKADREPRSRGIRLTVDQQLLAELVRDGYLDPAPLARVLRAVVVVKGKRLLTAYVRRGDAGLVA